MPTVNTVLGPVETSDLGFTLSHEHVGTNAAGLRHTYPEFIDRAGLLEQSVAAMREAYQAGVRTMVEMSTFDLGRDIGLIQRLMLSHDYSVPKARYGAEVQEARRRANPDSYTFISRRVLPRLQELGASDQDIHQITVENPRRFFEGS